MLGRVTKKSARQVLSLEWLEDRRLLSASFLGAALPLRDTASAVVSSLVSAVAPPQHAESAEHSEAQPLGLSSAVEHAVAQIPAVAVALVNSTVDKVVETVPAVVEAVPITAGGAVTVPSPLPD